MNMSDNSALRRVQPQDSHPAPAAATTYSFAPSAYPPSRTTQKNYVFVDEHNRHKRVKVMRACEGCRKRKIKCDAATTNSWPCSSCTRLKLRCVRPNGFDGAAENHVYETVPPSVHCDTSQQLRQDAMNPLMMREQQMLASLAKQRHPSFAGPDAPYTMALPMPPPMAPPLMVPAMFNTINYSADDPSIPENLNFHMPAPPPSASTNSSYPPPQSQPVFLTPPHQPIAGVPDSTPEHSSPPSQQQHQQHQQQQQHQQSQQQPLLPNFPGDMYTTDQNDQQDLADLLGSLKVDEAGTAPYLNSKMMRLGNRQEEQPQLEEFDEYKSFLPPLASGPGLKIRIPPELMPDDETVLHWFDLYFAHVHPYLPVLDKPAFYQQWQTDRESISPLIIEALLAIGSRLDDDPAQGQQWLALVTRHADSFMDVPRMSTLQALLIVLKAREAVPKRGYFYRSWMSIVQCVQLGKDLGLDDHFDDRQAGKPCCSSPQECALKTRVWQCIFVLETMIGSPQGRTDLAVDIDSVDFNVPLRQPSYDEEEWNTARSFTYLTRIVRNIGLMNKVYGKVRKTKDWGTNPEFIQLTTSLHAWVKDVPEDLDIKFPADESPPWLASPFVANAHSYYYLSLILFHRPQLAFLKPSAPDGLWKRSILICYNSAKKLCRLQEAILRTFGLSGLQCMLRGINFTIYAVLGCIVLHLVALTSPDPELNSDARMYFTRHMRILERCMDAWPMPEMQRQVDAVREAFSADTRKPFVLKLNFPCHSPPLQRLSPPQAMAYTPRPSLSHVKSAEGLLQQHQPHSHTGYPSRPISPPISNGSRDLTNDLSTMQQPLIASGGNNGGMAQTSDMQLTDLSGWDPSRIFDQWNTSFGTPQATPSPNSVHSQPPPHNVALNVGPPDVAEVPTLEDIQAAQSQLPQGAQYLPPSYPTAPVPTFITSDMWQESVASVYAGGLKRSWDYDST